MNQDRFLLPRTVQSLVCLLVKLKTGRKSVPYRDMTSRLQVQAVTRACGVSKHNRNLALVPADDRAVVFNVYRFRVPLHNSVALMPKSVEYQNRLTVCLFDKLV